MFVFGIHGNNYNNYKATTAPINFEGKSYNWRLSSQRISEELLPKINKIAEKYNKAHTFLRVNPSASWKSRQKYYQNLLFGTTIRGLKLKNFFEENPEHKLQIVRMAAKNEKELLTISRLDKDNNCISRYRITPKGEIYTPLETKNQPSFDTNILDKIERELDKINLVIDHYYDLEKIQVPTGENVFAIYEAQQRKGKANLKTEIDKITNKFSEFYNLYKDNPYLKIKYFGKSCNGKKTPYSFKIEPQGEVCTYTPISWDCDKNRTGIVAVKDSKSKIKKAYYLFSDGAIKTPMELNEDVIKPYLLALRDITASGEEEKEAKQILGIINSKMDEYIVDIKKRKRKPQIVNEIPTPLEPPEETVKSTIPKEQKPVLISNNLEQPNDILTQYKDWLAQIAASYKGVEKQVNGMITQANKLMDKLRKLTQPKVRAVKTQKAETIDKLMLPTEISKLSDSYNRVNDLITKNHNNYYTKKLKQEYFGEIERTKGYTLQHVGQNQETYVVETTYRKTDDRNYLIKVYNNDNTIQTAYVIHNSGEIKMLKKNPNSTVLSSNDLSEYNLKSVINASEEGNKVKQIISIINEQMENKANTITEDNAQKIRLKEQAKLKKLKKEVNKRITGDRNNASTGTSTDATDTIVTQGAKVVKTEKSEPKRRLPKTTRPQRKQNVTGKLYRTNNTTTKGITGDTIFNTIDNIFKTEIDGKRLGMKFQMTANDGAKITVSKISSKKYGRSYAITIEKETGTRTGTETETCNLNFDIENKSFIKLNAKGERMYDGKNAIYITPQELEQQYKDANLLQYFKEMNNVDIKALFEANSSNLSSQPHKLGTITVANARRDIPRNIQPSSVNTAFVSNTKTFPKAISDDLNMKNEIDTLLNRYNQYINPKKKWQPFRSVKQDGEISEFYSTGAIDGRNGVIIIRDKKGVTQKAWVLYNNGTIKKVLDINGKTLNLQPVNLRTIEKSSEEENEVIQKIAEITDGITAKLEKENHKPVLPQITHTAGYVPETTQNPTQSINQVAHAVLTEEEKIKAFNGMTLQSVANALSEIFRKPVEQRSPHLTHFRVSKDNILRGRFMMTASDGAKITVSKTKTNKLGEYTYYAIKVEKAGKEYTILMDKNSGKFISSNPEGHIIIKEDGNISTISKEKKLEKEPDIINLPQYIEEIKTFDETKPREILDFQVPKKTNGNSKPAVVSSQRKEKSEQVEQVEQEVLSKLNRLERKDVQDIEI